MTSASGAIPTPRPVIASHSSRTASQWPVRPLLLPVLVVTLALAAVLNDTQYPNARWLAALALGSFVLALRGPFWVLVPVILTELTLYGYPMQSVGAAQRLVVLLIAIIIATPAILRYGRLSDGRMLRVLVPSGLFVVFATIVNWMYSSDVYVFEYFRYQIGQMIALVLAATLIQSRRDLKRIALITLAIGLVAAVAAIWQHYAPTSAPFGVSSAQEIRGWKGRVMGFSGSPIALASQMIFLVPALIGVLICGPWRLDRRRIALGFALVILAGALNFSYTRSAFFAIGPSLLMMGFLVQGKRRLIVIGSVVVGFLMFQMLEGTGFIGDRYYEDASEDTSAASHEALWDVSFAVAMDNPITGIGHEDFERVSQEYLDEVQTSQTGPSGTGVIGKQRPHNDFLSVWLSWGILALIVYVGIFLGTLRNLAKAARHPDPFIRGLAIGCAGGVIAYAVNSAYHNSMDSSVFLWMYAGLSVALARMTPDVPRRNRPDAVPATHSPSAA